MGNIHSLYIFFYSVSPAPEFDIYINILKILMFWPISFKSHLEKYKFLNSIIIVLFWVTMTKECKVSQRSALNYGCGKGYNW